MVIFFLIGDDVISEVWGAKKTWMLADIAIEVTTKILLVHLHYRLQKSHSFMMNFFLNFSNTIVHSGRLGVLYTRNPGFRHTRSIMEKWFECKLEQGVIPHFLPNFSKFRSTFDDVRSTLKNHQIWQKKWLQSLFNICALNPFFSWIRVHIRKSYFGYPFCHYLYSKL